MPVGSRAVRFAWLGTPKFGWLRMLNISARKCSDLVSPNANCLKREKSQLTSLGPISVDRKSTRLNSSHGYISYAVFCLKKKKDLCESPRQPPCPDPCTPWLAQPPSIPPLYARQSRRRSLARRTRHSCPDLMERLCRSQASEIADAERMSEYQISLACVDVLSNSTKAVCGRDLRVDAGRKLRFAALTHIAFLVYLLSFFFLKDPAPPKFSPLPQHVALPI